MLSFPGDLSLYIKAFKSSLSVITPSHFRERHFMKKILYTFFRSDKENFF